MSGFQKFMFDTQFDAPPPAPAAEVELAPEPPPPPPAPTYSESELEAVRAQAYQRGLEDGIRQGRADALEGQEKLFNHLLENLAQRLTLLIGEQGSQREQQQGLMLQVALTIARKLLPAYTERQGLGEIEAATAQVIADVTGEPHLVVRVHDSQLDSVSIRLEQLAQQRGLGGKLVFLADASLGPADCTVEWADGGFERRSERIWQDIDLALAHTLRPAGN